jgi:hypothetical protein
MSTILYGSLTEKRQEAMPGTSDSISAPGLKNYLDGVAALVPAEVLGAHAFLISLTTETVNKITEPGTLVFVFWALIVVAIALYVAGHGLKNWAKYDFVRMLIPSAAFVLWTMLQRSTAFDAIGSGLADAPRTAISVIGAILLGTLATALSRKADEQPLPEPLEPPVG